MDGAQTMNAAMPKESDRKPNERKVITMSTSNPAQNRGYAVQVRISPGGRRFFARVVDPLHDGRTHVSFGDYTSIPAIDKVLADLRRTYGHPIELPGASRTMQDLQHEKNELYADLLRGDTRAVEAIQERICAQIELLTTKIAVDERATRSVLIEMPSSGQSSRVSKALVPVSMASPTRARFKTEA